MNALLVGSKVKFVGERRRYTVRVSNERFAVCTKPFAPRRTVLYTVVDLIEQVRGTENLIFGFGAESDEQCAEMLARLIAGTSEISRRNRVPLKFDNATRPVERGHPPALHWGRSA